MPSAAVRLCVGGHAVSLSDRDRAILDLEGRYWK